MWLGADRCDISSTSRKGELRECPQRLLLRRRKPALPHGQVPVCPARLAPTLRYTQRQLRFVVLALEI